MVQGRENIPWLGIRLFEVRANRSRLFYVTIVLITACQVWQLRRSIFIAFLYCTNEVIQTDVLLIQFHSITSLARVLQDVRLFSSFIIATLVSSDSNCPGYERIAKAVAADYDKNKRGSPMHLSLCLWGRVSSSTPNVYMPQLMYFCRSNLSYGPESSGKAGVYVSCWSRLTHVADRLDRFADNGWYWYIWWFSIHRVALTGQLCYFRTEVVKRGQYYYAVSMRLVLSCFIFILIMSCWSCTFIFLQKSIHSMGKWLLRTQRYGHCRFLVLYHQTHLLTCIPTQCQLEVYVRSYSPVLARSSRSHLRIW